MIGSSLVGLTLLAVLGALGVQLLRAILVEWDWLELLSLAYPLGSGVLTWLLFLLSWLGVQLTPFSVGATGVATLIVASWIAELRHNKGSSAMIRNAPLSGWEPQRKRPAIGLGLSLSVVMLAALAISVGRSYAAYDSMTGWALKGYGIAMEGSILAGREWGMWGLNYPLNIVIQVAAFFLFGNDLLPESKLLFPIYLACVCLGVFLFWRRFRVAPTLAVFGVILLATNPVVFLQSTNGYANLPFTAVLILGVLTGIDGFLRGDARRQFLSGLLLGIAVWTRPEGVVYAGLIAASLLGITRFARINRVQPFAFLSPLITIAIPWLIFAWLHHELDPDWIQHGDTAALAIASLVDGSSRGAARLFDLYLIIRLFIDRAVSPNNWGAYLPVLGSVLVLSTFIRRVWNRREIAHLAAVAAITIVIPVALYFALSIQQWPEFVMILRQDFDRAYLPAYFMTNVLAIALIHQGGDD